jgi:tetratricopeptide (TPR) repeat protein
MSESYFILNVSAESQTGTIIQKYLNLVEQLEYGFEYEYINGNQKVIDDFLLYQRAMDEILGIRMKKGENLEVYPPDIIKKIYYFRGKRKIIEGKYYDAGKNFEQALKYDGRDAKILYYLGRTLLASRKFTLAENAFKMAIGIDKQNPYFWVYLGDVYEAGGSLNKAIHMWEAAFNFDKSFEPAIERLQSKGVKVKTKILADKIKKAIKKIFGDKEKEDEEF